ncbi:saccharopine dehydrogenase family protein [Helicobacter japonicus]|uniref:Saccharopine dehydrogenase family protein n=9 Tax=Helicobacter japonicus TaxID=425400 RepID=A0A4U8TLH2_9HELI|nr:saccharopine dehydrogenase family protein [Helicobacter japonicus]TLE00539.1 saccharopine dehydrogenase family protein [Helicobacter japonicus]
MAVVLQIGAGGVGGVVAHKMAQNREVFSRIILASRTLSKCKAIADSIRAKGLGEIEVDAVDADNVESLVALIEKYRPKLVVNVALPYQDLAIMEACLRTKTHYLDTANYEHPDSAHFEYKEQWAYDTRYKEAGIFALLGSGFDPGVTNVFCAYAQKHYFDTIESIDILDCNAGDHGYAFATNFNPEINLREVSSKGRFWVKDSQSQYAQNFDLSRDSIYRKFERVEKHFKLESNTQDLQVVDYAGGQWRDIPPLALMKEWDYPEVGVKNSYLLYHEELESLVRNIKGLKRIRFFMTFGESYLTHMKCLENVGLLRVDCVEHKGQKIVPIEVLKTLLPDPASLASRTKGKTNIGCYIKGVKDGVERTIYIYNVCEHEKCYAEVNAQGVSYTTGVPAMIGAKLICEGKWGIDCAKVANGANNSDMPKGGEYQGIDNALELQNENNKNCAEVASRDRNSKIVDEKSGLRSCECGDKTQASIAQMSDKLSDLSLQAEFQGSGVWNMEQNDPDPFMQELNKQGLPYVVLEIESNGETKVLEDGRE